ncbi:alpha/beta fold hydrolase [Paenibacillus sp. sgz500958]|uniref:alpha/beta fold hydrolase n=1 Tax=Paenibacillus sp. sgz500958 TaxID=3242475 RepID=UPI0036D36CDD
MLIYPSSSGYTERFAGSGDSKLYCRYVRRGAPGVVFIAGLGDSSDTWDVVQARISQKYSRFSYDRAGTGRSQADLGPRTCIEMVEELSELLQLLEVEQPYILVGHSFDGLIARLYTSMYPQLVSGMVLIDAAAEYKELAYEEVLPDKLISQNREYYSNPMLNSERINKPHSYKQVAERTRKSDLNISIIIRGLPDEANDEWPHEEILRIDQQMQRDFLRLSTSSKCRMATGSGHYIHHDEPEIVIEEIMAMIKGG